MAMSHTDTEMKTVLHWFQEWSSFQKSYFLKDLVEKAVPTQLESLFDALETMSFTDKPYSLFRCQMKLFSQYFATWTDMERNYFVSLIEELDPEFVERFHDGVSETSGL